MPKSQETHENFMPEQALEVRALLDSARCVAVIGESGAGKTRLAQTVVSDGSTTIWVSCYGVHDEQEGLFRVARGIGLVELPVQNDEAIERVGRLLAGLGPVLLVLDHADALEALPFWTVRWLDIATELQLVTTHVSRRLAGPHPVFELPRAPDFSPIPLELDGLWPDAAVWLALLGSVPLSLLATMLETHTGLLETKLGGLNLVGHNVQAVEMPDPMRDRVLVQASGVLARACETLCERLARCFDDVWSQMADVGDFERAQAWWLLIRRASRAVAKCHPVAAVRLAAAHVQMAKWGDVGLDDVANARRVLARVQSGKEVIEQAVACVVLDIELGFIGRARGLHVDILMKMTQRGNEPSEWVSRAMQVAGARLAMHVDANAAVERLEGLAQTWGTMPRLESLLDLGTARLAAFRVADASDAFQAAMDVAEGLDPRLVIRARLGLAQVSWRMGYTERARAQFEIALAQLPESTHAAQTPYDFGVVLHHLGDMPQARENLVRASRIWAKLGDERRLAAYHVRRGVLEFDHSDQRLARVHFLAAQDSARQAADAHLLTLARACQALMDDAFDEREFRAVEENIMVGRDPEAVVTFATAFGLKTDMARAVEAVESVERLLGLEDLALKDICQAALNTLRGDAPPLGALAPMFRTLVRHARRREVRKVTAQELVIHPQGHWFVYNGQNVDLLNRKPLRRILEALVQDWRSGGDGLTVDEVLAAGWPGELVEARSGANRVYATIRLLRKTGLEDAITNEEGVYRIDPGLQVRVSEE